jgi:hypothetical protein
LQHLHLSADMHRGQISRLQQLTALTHLGLRGQVLSAEHTMSEAVSASLPLRWLHVFGSGGATSNGQFERVLLQLGSCTQLTFLQLSTWHDLNMTGSVASLSAQLQRLPGLQELQLVAQRAAEYQGPIDAEHDQGGVISQGVVGEESVWGPLFNLVPSLAPLRTLNVDRVLLVDSDVDALGGASQLTCLRLAGCGISAAAAARVRSAFAHLPDCMVRIE